MISGGLGPPFPTAIGWESELVMCVAHDLMLPVLQFINDEPSKLLELFGGFPSSNELDLCTLGSSELQVEKFRSEVSTKAAYAQKRQNLAVAFTTP